MVVPMLLMTTFPFKMCIRDRCGLDARTAAAAVHGFGGGFGRMREVCGTVCGGIFVLNMMFADEDDSPQKKRAHYARVQQFMRLFEAQEGSYLCRVLLGVSGPEDVYKRQVCGKRQHGAVGSDQYRH